MTEASESGFDASRRLLVFADDWGRHPSSCQHLIRRLLPRYHVGWVDTIGMRTPSLNWETVSRGLEKLSHWLGPKRPTESLDLPANLTVLRPRMWPWFTRRFDRTLNRRLLTSQLGCWCRDAASPPIAITTLPIVADLMGPLPVSRWVYYCVDDFSQWPGVDQKTMLSMERTVIEKADVLIAVSRHLQNRLAQQGRASELLIHGVDLDFWRQPGPTARLPHGFHELERPLVVFWGLIDRRMDVNLVRRLSERFSKGTIVLVGPESDPDPTLMEIPHVRRLPAQPLEVLPALGQAASVLIMPYADLPVTQAMQPLKMLEYLATGRPVVVRRLPSTEEWSDCLDAVTTPDDFAAAVLKRLETGTPVEQAAARQRLTRESWQAKAEQFERWMSGPPSGRPAVGRTGTEV
jgi:glycosyltransferase involved in cell wall biosynthesis